MLKNCQNICKISFPFQRQFSGSSHFKTLKINEYLKKSIETLGYTSMTTIQNKALPLLIEKNNCLLLSETGTGKTLCYLIPILNEILNEKEKDPSTEENILKVNKRKGAIILSPSKELCVQIYSVARKLDKENHVNIMRAGPLCYKSPLVKFVVRYKKRIEIIHFIIFFRVILQQKQLNLQTCHHRC